MTMSVFREKVRNLVLPYYNRNDAAHQIDHPDDVYAVAMEINAAQNLGLDERLIILACYFHDIHAFHRDEHHELAFDHVLTIHHDVFEGLSFEELYSVARACLEHRASWHGGYYDMLSQCVAAADRGRPNELDTYIDRSYKYAKSKLGYDDATAHRHSIIHVKEKFGRGGYAAFPPLYVQHYQTQMDALYDAIDALTL